ncbi:MAG: NYN domain-containing protein [Immundisolibacteraceae bacterium]|nr:NYN domain-containing protein [Immundisolibacteraceae bacterium]
MQESSFTPNIAVFCDFENVALGVKETTMPAFEINKVLDRLLLKGNIVVKKAYCDWQRYKEFKAPMHEAAFELIEVPHTRMAGKNSADIRMVVDALDLCYTKEHMDTFAVITGDSDFSPLVSKLRENNKRVIGIGVKNSSSNLLISNCDEFIFYDDLVDKKSRRRKKPKEVIAKSKAKASGKVDEKVSETVVESAPNEALEIVVEVIEDLLRERGDQKVWSSMVKQTLRRQHPDFNETTFGYKNFSALLEQARDQGLMQLERDDNSGNYLILGVN